MDTARVSAPEARTHVRMPDCAVHLVLRLLCAPPPTLYPYRHGVDGVDEPAFDFQVHHGWTASTVFKFLAVRNDQQQREVLALERSAVAF